jgi:hypothetical protein
MMSIDYGLKPNSPDASRPTDLRRIVAEEMPKGAQKAWTHGAGYRGAEVDVESDGACISFHMHGSQTEEETEACFRLMDRLASRLGWTLFDPMGEPLPTKVGASKSATKPAPPRSPTRYRHPTFGDATLVRRQDNSLRLHFDDGTERIIQERFLTPLDG